MCIACVENPTDPKKSYPTLADMTTAKKLDRLRELFVSGAVTADKKVFANLRSGGNKRRRQGQFEIDTCMDTGSIFHCDHINLLALKPQPGCEETRPSKRGDEFGRS